MTTAEQLERIKHYATRYELAAEHPDGRKIRVLYTSRKGRAGILAALRQRFAVLAPILGDGQAIPIQWGKRAADGCTAGQWRIRFTGRTQRDAIIAGELEGV